MSSEAVLPAVDAVPANPASSAPPRFLAGLLREAGYPVGESVPSTADLLRYWEHYAAQVAAETAHDRSDPAPTPPDSTPAARSDVSPDSIPDSATDKRPDVSSDEKPPPDDRRDAGLENSPLGDALGDNALADILPRSSESSGGNAPVPAVAVSHPSEGNGAAASGASSAPGSSPSDPPPMLTNATGSDAQTRMAMLTGPAPGGVAGPAPAAAGTVAPPALAAERIANPSAAPVTPAAAPAQTPAAPATVAQGPSAPTSTNLPAPPSSSSGLAGIDPSIAAVEGVPFTGTVAEFTDADGNTNPSYYMANISWGDGQSSGGSVSYANGTFSVQGTHTYAELGSHTTTTTISDTADGATVTVSGTATVADASLAWTNNAPTITWNASTTAPPFIPNPGAQANAEGNAVALPVAASDPNNYPLTYDALGLPTGLSINPSTGLIAGTVDYSAAEVAGGSYSPTVIVVNGHGGSASTTFSWIISDTDRAPTLTNPGNQSSGLGATVALQLNGSDPDAAALTYDATGLPSGLSLDSSSGLIAGTPDSSAVSATPYAVTATVTDGILTATQSFTWIVTAANQTPTVTNPGSQVNASGDAVSLALAGSDSDGDTLTWTATGLPAGLTIDPSSGTLSGTLAASAASATPYTATITASDGITSASQNFTWAVNYVGLSSPGDQANVNGDTVSLPIAASSAGASLSYSASNLPPGLSLNPSTGVIAGTLSTTADAASPYTTTLTASDGTHSASTTLTWTVAHLALTNPGNQFGREATAVSLQLQGRDADGDPLTYTATGLPAGLSLSSNGLISGTLDAAAHGRSPYQVTVTASDGSHSVSQAFVWTVTPRVALVNPGNQANATGDSVSLPVQASTVGGTLSYSAANLPPGLGINAATGLISGTVAGSASSTPYAVTVTATDGTSSSSQSFTWTVAAVVVAAPGDQTNLDGDSVSLPLATHYHGSGTLSYSATGLPPGLGINSATGTLSGSIANTADTNSPYAVTVTASDGSNSASQTFNWTINPRVSLYAVADQGNAAGDVVALALSASDASGAALTWTASGLPPGLSINSSGLVSGTIATGADAGGPYVVTVTAADASASSSITFTWNVAHVRLANPGTLISVDGDTVALTLQGRDADGDSLSYTAVGLPPGLGINSSTGFIGGTLPTTADQGGPYLVTVTASDGSHSSSQTFLWTVTQVGVSNPGDQANTEGDTVSVTVTARGAAGPWTYSAGNLPAGLAINPTTGAIGGTLAAGAADAGPTSVTVAASNGSVSTSQTFTWTVNPRVTLTALADRGNVEGDIVALQTTASDTAAAVLTYSADSLPPGLSINTATGLIVGTITAGAASGGPYLVTVTASDGGGYSSSAVFTWTVTAVPNTPPTLANPGTQSNTAGDAVSLALTASALAGDALTFSASTLPDGLAIDPYSGVISGTLAPDAASVTPYVVTVTADNGAGGTTSQTFAWIVNDAPLSIQATPVAATEGVDTGSVTVATFTTPDLGSQAGDFTATVTWGDGTSDSGTVSGGNGTFSVTDDHNYAEAGAFPVSVQISDNSGGSATASATATVTDAALTLTGGFQAGAVAGQSVMCTLATLNDANANAAASDYHLSIDWGDGSGTTGGYIATEGGGFFALMAPHSYTLDGTYTVTLQVTDADGATATTSSTVAVGVLYAGAPAILSVYGFSDANSSAPASDFTAQIQWGDGSSSVGTVSGANGIYGVSGSHTYAADSFSQPGGVYQVSVTVQDVDGSTLSRSTSVAVERPALALSVVNTVVVPASLIVTNAEVAAFTEADTLDSSAEFSATISWGDGSSSNGTITGTGSAGLFHVLGSHTYATANDYVIQVTVLQHWDTLLVAAQGQVPGTILPLARRTVEGPTAIPGMSQYEYYVRISNTGIPKNQLSDVVWDFGRSAQVFGYNLETYTLTGNTNLIVGYGGTFRFRSGPATVNLQLQFRRTLDGRTTNYASQILPVDVVSVRVALRDGGRAPFTAGVAPVDGGTLRTEFRIDGQLVNREPFKTIDGAPPGRAAIIWRAEVELRSPTTTRNPARRIQVGFLQQTQFVVRRVFFATARRFLVSDLVNNRRYLDVENGPGPLYNTDRAATLDGARDGATKTIGSDDTPSVRAPLVRANESAARIEVRDQFWLYVAARTTDAGIFHDDQKYFSEASTEWVFNGSGQIGSPRAMPIPGPWTAIPRVTGTFPANPNQWTLPTVPLMLDTSGPTANTVQRTLNISWRTTTP